MSDGTWYESPLTCITLYYRQCDTEMYVRWNLVRKPFNQRHVEQLLTMHENEVTNSSSTTHDGICFNRIPIMNCKALKFDGYFYWALLVVKPENGLNMRPPRTVSNSVTQ